VFPYNKYNGISTTFSADFLQYLQNVLTGPDLRKYFDQYEEILAVMRDVIAVRHGPDLAEEFFTDYCSTLSHIVIVSRLTRKTDILTAEEITQLDDACKGFAAAFRIVDAKRTYADQHHIKGTLTAKGHVVEKHVIEYAKRFGTCGRMGEDGLESLHPLDTAARVLNRSIRNHEARIVATANRVAFTQSIM
jgi:hypothetical protein